MRAYRHTSRWYRNGKDSGTKFRADTPDSPVSLRSEDKRIRPEASEVTRLWASTKKAQQLLGWYPRFGGLEGLREGLKQTIEWFSIPTNLEHYKPNHYAI
jgi:dTDP-glucose 4,6-dehydratase